MTFVDFIRHTLLTLSDGAMVICALMMYHAGNDPEFNSTTGFIAGIIFFFSVFMGILSERTYDLE